MMTQRVVIVQGCRIGLGTYAEGWRRVRELKPDVQVKCFNWFADSAANTLRRFREGMHDRINRRVDGFGHVLRPETKRGRKDCSDWYWLMWRTSRQLNTPRLVIHWLPPELRERFAHRLSN